MQRVINKALKFIDCNEDNDARLKELHEKYNITPLNRIIDIRAKKIWESVKATEPEHYHKLIESREREHKWFPKTSNIIHLGTPQAIITRQQ